MAETGSRIFICILFSVLLMACRNTNQKSAGIAPPAKAAATQTMNEKETRLTTIAAKPAPANTPEQVAPGSCRVVGEITAIKPQLEPDKATPCGQVPCKAMVKIKKVIAYGSAFKPPLSEGQEIPVYFAFTLSPTAAYFPGLSTALPGLQVGNVFQADVRNPAEGGASTPAWYQVFTYTVIM